MNQTENNEQTTQQNKTIWKLAVAAFIFAAMFFGANALAGQNVLLNIVCALVLAGAAVFCGRKISSHHKFTTREVAFIGMMSAIVFVSNYISFTIPLAIGGDITRVHVANAFCLLAGLSLGPVAGGLSAGIGSMMYDFTIPQFIAGSPFTFAFKFLMAYTAGCVVGKSKDKIAPARIITAGVLGQLCYIVLYIGKKFITYHFLHGEPLNVTLKVNGKRPDWTVNPADYKFNMSVYGQMKINGRFSNDTEDMLAAFEDDVCVGVATNEYIKVNDMYYALLTVYGNTGSHNKLEFKMWDASTGKIYIVEPETPVAFKANSIVGSPKVPVVFSNLDKVQLDVALNNGWTWTSFNVMDEDMNDLSQVLKNSQYYVGSIGKAYTGEDAVDVTKLVTYQNWSKE